MNTYKEIVENPLKIYVWGIGEGYWEYHNLLSYQEHLGEIEILGYISRDKIQNYFNNRPIFEPKEINNRNVKFDLFLVTTEKYFKQIVKENSKELCVEKSLFVNAKIMKIPHFDWRKYISICNNKISIVAESCIGGLLLNNLGMKFNSPFVDVRVGTKRRDFFEFLNNLEAYMRQSPCQVKHSGGNTWYGEEFGRLEYPLLQYENILLHGFHYNSQQEFYEIWEKRRKRYNFNNNAVFKILYNDEDVEEFEQIRIKKKIGIYYKKTQYDNIIYIPFENEKMVSYSYYWMLYVNDIFSSGRIFRYMDIFSFLC